MSHRPPVLAGVSEDGIERRRPDGSLTFIDDETGTEIELTRTQTCAIFHNLSSGTGVPHAFYAFLRQLPALPRLIVEYWERPSFSKY